MPFERPGRAGLAEPDEVGHLPGQDLRADADLLGAYLQDAQRAVWRQPDRAPQLAALLSLRQGLMAKAMVGRDGGWACLPALAGLWTAAASDDDEPLTRRVRRAMTCEMHVLRARRAQNLAGRGPVRVY